jgi:hypothetical protein
MLPLPARKSAGVVASSPFGTVATYTWRSAGMYE